MYSLNQYLFSLSDPDQLTRTLHGIEPLRDALGELRFVAGNSAAIFPIRYKGRLYALRCYFRPMQHLRPIYGERYLPEELYLWETTRTGRWVDVVMTDWIEGETLQTAIDKAVADDDRLRLQQLSASFDRLAAKLLADDWAHGDLKPDNLIVEPSGALRLIDFDAMYLPALRGMHASEIGTSAYQHPSRTAEAFDERLDDYSTALIASALHALQLDPSLYARYRDRDGLLFDPSKGTDDAAYREVMELFAKEGDALWYRICGTLGHTSYRLPHLIDLFAQLVERENHERQPIATTDDNIPELFVEQGRWGFRTEDRVVVPPLYDEGFDFSEGLAAVRLGRYWHFIDPRGRTVLHCPACDAVKPFREGYATLVCGKRRQKIDKRGELFDF